MAIFSLYYKQNLIFHIPSTYFTQRDSSIFFTLWNISIYAYVSSTQLSTSCVMCFKRRIPVCLKEDFLGIPSRTLKHVSSSFVYASKVGICCSHPITYEQNYLVIKYNMPSYCCCFRCHNSSCSYSNCRQNPFVISNLNAQI